MKEADSLGELAHEARLCPDQLRETDLEVGGRFDPKFIPGPRVRDANALPKELPGLPPAEPFMLCGPFEPAPRPPNKPELLFGREANPPELLYEPPPFCRGGAENPRGALLPPKCPPPPPFCRGAAENPRPELLPPPCPPPPKWNPPPSPLWILPPPLLWERPPP